jgi:hypothetical protein
MIPEVIRTFENAIELHKKKNQDYTGGRIDLFFNFNVAEYVATLFASDRDRVFATMVGIKLARLAALLELGKPNFESVLDSFDDMIVYTAIWKADVQRRPVKIDLNNEDQVKHQSIHTFGIIIEELKGMLLPDVQQLKDYLDEYIKAEKRKQAF